MATKTTTAKSASAATRTPKQENALKELFVDELKDIYWAEQHLVKALPKMIKGATSDELKQTIKNDKYQLMRGYKIKTIEDFENKNKLNLYKNSL